MSIPDPARQRCGRNCGSSQIGISAPETVAGQAHRDTQQRSSHEQAFQLLRLATDTTSFIRHKWFALFLQQCIDSDGEYGDVLQTNADGKSVLDDFGEESKLSVDAFARLGEYKKGIHVIHVHRRQRRMQIRTTLCTIYQSEHIHEIISIVTNYCLTENMSYDKWAASK